MNSPPGNANAALAKRRRENLTGLALDNSGSGFTQPCAHPVTRTERLPDGSPHFARLTCALCNRHLRWLPRPETVERERVNAFRLARLAMCEGLNPWERGFVRSVSQLRKISPRQQQILDELVEKHLEHCNHPPH
jgi:hypothetical protein